MQPPPQGWPPPPGYPPPPPQRPPSTGWEGSKTLVTAGIGCIILVGVIVIGPWVGCAACITCAKVANEISPPPRSTAAQPVKKR